MGLTYSIADMMEPEVEVPPPKPPTEENLLPHPRKAAQKIVMMAEAIVSLIGVFCLLMVNDDRYSAAAGGWFIFVAMTAVFKNFAALVLHRDSSSYFRRLIMLAEMVFNFTWTVFYLMAAAAVASRGAYDDAYAAAAFFGFVCMILFAIDTGNMFCMIINYDTLDRVSRNV